MKSRTAVRNILAGLLCLVSSGAKAQLSCENPLEYAVLAEGNILINEQYNSQIRGQLETAALENIIAVEFDKIHSWEQKYSSYTKTVSGYASSLNAATHIYDDALRIMLSIGDLRTAMSDNPQGIVATMSMNTIYIEAATELISCFTLIRNAVATGGDRNMLTGAERSQVMWAINDKLDAFSKKLQKLTLCIRFYRMSDVWNTYTAGMFERNNGTVADDAHDRWVRAARAIQ